jgi:hypothetical protein
MSENKISIAGNGMTLLLLNPLVIKQTDMDGWNGWSMDPVLLNGWMFRTVNKEKIRCSSGWLLNKVLPNG